MTCRYVLMLTGCLLYNCYVDNYSKEERGIDINRSRVLRSTNKWYNSAKSLENFFPEALISAMLKSGEGRKRKGRVLVRRASMALGAQKPSVSDSLPFHFIFLFLFYF